MYLGQEHAFTRLGVLWPPCAGSPRRTALEDVGLATSPRAIVSDLSYEERKLVEVARAVSLRPKVLVIDETTASLSHQGTQLLYRQIRRLPRRRDVQSSTSPTTSRRCSNSATGSMFSRMGNWSEPGISGRFRSSACHTPWSAADLDLHAVCDRHDRRQIRGQHNRFSRLGLSKEGDFRDITFDVSPGEIVGIGGIVGCGSLEVGRCLFGVLTADTGTISLQNRPITPRNPRDAVHLGIGYVPKERDDEGLILPFSIRDNVALAVLDQMRRLGLISPATEERLVQGAIRRYRVKAEGTGTVCLNLSGGMQKVVLAKWLATGAKGAYPE